MLHKNLYSRLVVDEEWPMIYFFRVVTCEFVDRVVARIHGAVFRLRGPSMAQSYGPCFLEATQSCLDERKGATLDRDGKVSRVSLSALSPSFDRIDRTSGILTSAEPRKEGFIHTA